MEQVRDNFEAFQDILQRIGRLNDLIKAHIDQGDADSVSVSNWQEIKRRLILDLADLLKDMDVDLSVAFKQAA
jgi:hypothetical protein